MKSLLRHNSNYGSLMSSLVVHNRGVHNTGIPIGNMVILWEWESLG